ncbi:MAG: biotin--[acetyl-CoA-carboxylase] ligase [Blastocatellia bacterium]|nr:biotin--[acetyl-CoA-carboxylase] ligase [Blastocatellia bacterium]
MVEETPKRIISKNLASFSAKIFHFEQIDSTNTFLKKYAQNAQIEASQNPLEGVGALADMQTAGRGRMQRSWYSATGEGCYFSLLLTPKLDLKSFPLISLMSAVATAEAIMESCPVAIDIKWPNDILINNCKVSGILIESSFKDSNLNYIIVGIGVNLSQKSFPEGNFNRLPTSIYLATGLIVDRDNFLDLLLKKLDYWYQILNIKSDNILKRWEELSSFAKGKKIKVILNNKEVLAVTDGLLETGALKIKDSTGQEIILYGNEITSEGETICY